MAKFRIIERVYRYYDIETDSFESAENSYNQTHDENLPCAPWKSISEDLDEIINLDSREHLLF